MREKFKIEALFAALAVMACCGVCAGEAFTTGWLTPPGGCRAVRVAAGEGGVKTAALLKAAAKDAVPSQWDSRDYRWIGPVKNQGNVGACWAFAAYETLETQLRKAGRGVWDFSEKNMVNLHGFDVGFNVGGNNDMAAAYLMRWGGAVAETNDTYVTNPNLWKQDSKPMNPPVHVQSVVWVPARTSATDNDGLKRAIMKYGAVCVAMHFDGGSMGAQGAYFYNGAKGCDHAVTVVGWDDGYSAANFNKSSPEGDGAWLVKNSHGNGSGDAGYLHVSYYDTKFAREETGAVFIPAADDEDYTAVHGYDTLANVFCLDFKYNGTFPIAAIFKAAWNEELAAIGVFTRAYPLEYTLSIYTNLTDRAVNPRKGGGALARTQKGTLDAAGYFTIKLNEPLALAPGTNFSVVFESSNTNAPSYFAYSASATSNGEPYCTFTPTAYATFYYDAKANSWRDSASALNGNICLKAYTRTTAQAGDSGPGETTDGTPFLAELAATNLVSCAQFAGSFGAFANIVGANSRSLWYSWLTGLDPADKLADANFTLSISLANGVPRIAWSPDLGDNARNYTIFGKYDLSDDEWFVIDGRDAVESSGARYFRVDVAPLTTGGN